MATPSTTEVDFSQWAKTATQTISSKLKTLGENSQTLLDHVEQLVLVKRLTGNLKLAASLQGKHSRLTAECHGKDHPLVAESLVNLAEIQLAQENKPAAKKTIDQALEILKDTTENVTLARAYSLLAEIDPRNDEKWNQESLGKLTEVLSNTDVTVKGVKRGEAVGGVGAEEIADQSDSDEDDFVPVFRMGSSILKGYQ